MLPGIIPAPLVGRFSVAKSLSFAASSSQYASRTEGAPTSNQIGTFAFWAKPVASSVSFYDIFGYFNATSTFTDYVILTGTSSPTTGVAVNSRISAGSSTQAFAVSSTSGVWTAGAWHHVCVAIDTTQATATNRVKIYVNGIDVTDTVGSTYPTQNQTCSLLSHSGGTAGICVYALGGTPSNYLDGKLTDFYRVDGLALPPEAFIEGRGSGACHPKRYTGSFGAQGFWLTFNDSTSQTTLGHDDHGGNPGSNAGSINWTLTNTPTSSTDTPR
jgi:hypothetical protein